MKDQDWKYRIELTGSIASKATVPDSLWITYTNSTLVAFQSIIGLQLERFGKPGPQGVEPRYYDAKIIDQPTGETVAVTLHYPLKSWEHGIEAGLYLKVRPSLDELEKNMGIALEPIRSKTLPAGYLHLGSYNTADPQGFEPHPGLEQINEDFGIKRSEIGKPMYQLELTKDLAGSVNERHICYEYDDLNHALLALVDQDLSLLQPSAYQEKGITISNMKLLGFWEDLLEVRYYPPTGQFQGTGTGGVFYKVNYQDAIETLSKAADLFILPYYPFGKPFFQVGTVDYNGRPSPLPALAKFRQQLIKDMAPEASISPDKFRLEFHYRDALEAGEKSGNAYYSTAVDAIKALCGLEPANFNLTAASSAFPKIEKVHLFNTTSDELVATMAMTSHPSDGLPAGVFLAIDKAHVTPELSTVLASLATEYRNGGQYHFLLAKAGELSAIHQKQYPKPRTLIDRNGPGRHL